MIGSNIKKYRLMKNLTQKELAENSNVTRESIGNYERGDRTPPADILNKIAVALDIPVTKLLSDEDELDGIDSIDRALIDMVGEDAYVELILKNQNNVEYFIKYLKTLIPGEIPVDIDLNSLSNDDKKTLFFDFTNNMEIYLKAFLYDQSNNKNK